MKNNFEMFEIRLQYLADTIYKFSDRSYKRVKKKVCWKDYHLSTLSFAVKHVLVATDENVSYIFQRLQKNNANGILLLT